MDKLLEAIYFATSKHLSQKRKDNITPYIEHPLGVALLVQKYTNDEDTIIAGILHDAIEDTETTEDEIARLFGEKVAKIVDEVSEKDKSLDWEKRKEIVLASVKNLSNEAALVKLADKTHNYFESKKKYAELGITYFNSFSVSFDKKLEYEKKCIREFKNYHNNTELINKIEELLSYLEQVYRQ
jgi:(p)ppGpp synthase/HD superfamily hydrolase